MEKNSQPSKSTNIIVATTRINQNKPASLFATGPAGFKMEGELSPQAARRSEDKTNVESSTPQRFIPRNNGILTSHSPKYCLSMVNSIIPYLTIFLLCVRTVVTLPASGLSV